MTWFIFAFLTATFESLKDVTSKHTIPRSNEYVVAWAWMIFAVPFLLPAVLIQGIPEIKPQFWVALGVSTLILSSSLVLYMKAIKASDLSLTIPMIAFTPMFMLITSPLIVGEFPPPLGIVGVLLIVAGSYVLNIKELRKGLKGLAAPYRALLREQGPRMMLLVAFLWSINGNIDKIGIQNSAPFFWIMSANAVSGVVITPIMLWNSKQTSQITANWKYLILIGLLAALVGLSQMTALTMTLVAYVISVKRFSVVLGVLFGGLLFKEKGLSERLTGVFIMVAGVLCITLS